MTQEATVDHEHFLSLVSDSAAGDRQKLRRLYDTFLTHRFFVPERYQQSKLSLEPDYPNDFINVLGVKDQERVFVPIFSSKEGPREWLGKEVKTSLISGQELLQRLPKEWWLIINPHSEIIKELSPWEIEQLRSGDQGIDAVIEDVMPSLVRERSYSLVSDKAHTKLKNILKELAQKTPGINGLYLLEQHELLDEKKAPLSSLIVGLDIRGEYGAELEKIRDQIEDALRLHMIGGADISVVAGLSMDSLSLSIFKNTPALWLAKHQGILHRFTLIDILSLVLLLGYGFLFWKDLSPYWFNPEWTTDDALQQVYPFHEVLSPGLFKDDLITEVMRGYLAPVHYWLSYSITWLTRDPLIMSHWVMLIQFVLTCAFLFFAVKKVSAITPAALSVLWFLHTRPMVQRMTGGLPRGWAAPILSAYLYFILSKNHGAVLVTIFIGCLLHPPATLTISLAYGIFLLWKVIGKEGLEYRGHFLKLILLSPLFALVTFSVISRPESIGQMVDYQTAAGMPEFQWPSGRFPFIPLKDISFDIKAFAFQPFMSRLLEPGETVAFMIPIFILALFMIFIWTAIKRKREIVPLELGFFFVATVASYLAARLFAFKLYVPNRHLQFPMGIFLIVAISIGLWRLFCLGKDFSCLKAKLGCPKGFLAFLLLAVIIYAGSGDGLIGSANFNYHAQRKGRAFIWIKEHTPSSALFAGHPTHINGLPLFGARRAYATTETAHPFYPNYYSEIKRRLIISLKAHYAKTLNEFLNIVEPEGIDYFVFSKKRFYPDALKKEYYFSPLNELVRELTSRNPNDYAYKRLPAKVDLAKYPFLVFRDHESAIVDVRSLRKYGGILK